MNNMQAAKLPIGACIRRKGATGDDAVYTVERTELPADRHKESVIVHAGGHAFRAWEIERVNHRWGWPSREIR